MGAGRSTVMRLQDEARYRGEVKIWIDEGVADVMSNFLDQNGNPVPHPLNDKIMSVALNALRNASHVVVAGGGVQCAKAILAVTRCIGCNSLITDEATAKAILVFRE